MNKLSTDERKSVVAALVEGNSLRAVTRMTGVHRTTVMKLLVNLGRECSNYQNRVFRNLACKRIQCDEIWSFCYAKAKNVPAEKRSPALVAATWCGGGAKRIPCTHVMSRSAPSRGRRWCNQPLWCGTRRNRARATSAGPCRVPGFLDYGLPRGGAPA